MSGKNDTIVHKRRRKVKGNNETNESGSEEEEEGNEPMETNPSEPVVTHDDGVFTVMIHF